MVPRNRKMKSWTEQPRKLMVFPGPQKTDQHLRDTACGEAEVQEGRRGSVTSGSGALGPAQQDDECVAHQSQEVRDPRQPGRGFFQALGVQRGPEGRSPLGAVVDHGLFLSRPRGMKAV